VKLLARFMLWAGLATLVCVSAWASGPLREVPTILDPTKGYALVEIRNHDGGPQPGIVTFARYDPVDGDVRGGLRSPGSSLGRGVAVRVSAVRRSLLRNDERRLFLLELEPDIWVIEGAAGTAFSLGSLTFTVRAGEVLDLGVFSPRTDWPDGEGPTRLTAGRLVGMALLGPFARTPEPRPAMLEIRRRDTGDFPVPDSLASRIVPAQFNEGARFGNYLGGLVNRVNGREGRPGEQQPASPEEPPSEPVAENRD
jgi:hypothetical protein